MAVVSSYTGQVVNRPRSDNYTPQLNNYSSQLQSAMDPKYLDSMLSMAQSSTNSKQGLIDAQAYSTRTLADVEAGRIGVGRYGHDYKNLLRFQNNLDKDNYGFKANLDSKNRMEEYAFQQNPANNGLTLALDKAVTQRNSDNNRSAEKIASIQGNTQTGVARIQGDTQRDVAKTNAGAAALDALFSSLSGITSNRRSSNGGGYTPSGPTASISRSGGGYNGGTNVGTGVSRAGGGNSYVNGAIAQATQARSRGANPYMGNSGRDTRIMGRQTGISASAGTTFA